jgi:3-oxoacyl-[acyl-carrier protein] reductase
MPVWQCDPRPGPRPLPSRTPPGRRAALIMTRHVLLHAPVQNERMDLGLRDRVFLVTGGSRGLGFAAAQALVADGARVLISAPHESTAAAAAARLTQDATAGAGTAVAWAVADNADPGAASYLTAAARERFGRLDGALISVGGSPGGSVADTGDDAWRSAFESVFLGAVRLSRVLAAGLGGERQDGAAGAALTGTAGSIAFVLAGSVRAPLPGLAISNGLFPALAGVVKTLADELGPSGIRVNGLMPVRVATDRVRQLDALLGDPDEVRARLSRNIPLRRYGEPTEFGRAAAFVLSPAASYITGAMIPVDGGAIRSI